MAIKNFCVSLEEEVVKKAKAITDANNQKLSPVINDLLKTWMKKQEEECQPQ